jgi:hypothetical protein
MSRKTLANSEPMHVDRDCWPEERQSGPNDRLEPRQTLTLLLHLSRTSNTPCLLD